MRNGKVSTVPTDRLSLPLLSRAAAHRVKPDGDVFMERAALYSQHIAAAKTDDTEVCGRCRCLRPAFRQSDRLVSPQTAPWNRPKATCLQRDVLEPSRH